MSWLPILLLAAATFVMAVYWLKLARSLWMLFGSAIRLTILQLPKANYDPIQAFQRRRIFCQRTNISQMSAFHKISCLIRI